MKPLDTWGPALPENRTGKYAPIDNEAGGLHRQQSSLDLWTVQEDPSISPVSYINTAYEPPSPQDMIEVSFPTSNGSAGANFGLDNEAYVSEKQTMANGIPNTTL